MKLPLTILARMSAAFATNLTTSLWLVGFNDQEVLGSVVRANPTATTYALACGNPQICRLPTPFTLTQGPSTVVYSYTEYYTAAVDLGLEEDTLTAGVVAYGTGSGPTKTSSIAESTPTYGVNDGVTATPVDGGDESVISTGAVEVVIPAPFWMGAMAFAIAAI